MLPLKPVAPHFCYDCINIDQFKIFALTKHSLLLSTSLKVKIYDNDYLSIIDIYFYETFSTPTQTFSACARLFRQPVQC